MALTPNPGKLTLFYSQNANSLASAIGMVEPASYLVYESGGVGSFPTPTAIGGQFTDLVLSPDSSMIAATSSNSGKYVYVYDAATHQQLAVLLLTSPTVVNVHAVFSPDGTKLAIPLAGTAGFDVFDMTTFQRINTPAQGGQAAVLAWSPDGTKLAVALETNLPYLKVYNVADWTTITLPASSMVAVSRGIAWSPDGSQLAVSHYAASSTTTWLTVFETTTWTKLNTPVQALTHRGVLAYHLTLPVLYCLCVDNSSPTPVIGLNTSTFATTGLAPITQLVTGITKAHVALGRYLCVFAGNSGYTTCIWAIDLSLAVPLNVIANTYSPTGSVSNLYAVTVGMAGFEISNANGPAVTDSDGAPLAGVAVRVYLRSTGLEISFTTTNAEGKWRILCRNKNERQVMFIGSQAHEGSVLIDRVVPA